MRDFFCIRVEGGVLCPCYIEMLLTAAHDLLRSRSAEFCHVCEEDEFEIIVTNNFEEQTLGPVTGPSFEATIRHGKELIRTEYIVRGKLDERLSPDCDRPDIDHFVKAMFSNN